MGVFLGIAILTALILVHEFGHMLAARRAGVRVRSFCVGIGERPIKSLSWTSRRTGTTYGIAPFPIGGMVDLKGMRPPETPLMRPVLVAGKPLDPAAGETISAPLASRQEDFGDLWLRLPDRFKKELTGVTGLPPSAETLLLPAAVVALRDAIDASKPHRGHRGSERAVLLSFLDGCVAQGLSLSLAPEVSVDPSDDNFYTKPFWKKAAILTSGSLMNLLVGWLMLLVLTMTLLDVPTGEPVPAAILPDSPAARAGVVPGDVFTGFEDASGRRRPIAAFSDISAARESGAEVFWVRHGTAERRLVLVTDPPPGSSQRMLLGLIPATRNPTLLEGLGSSARIFGELVRAVGTSYGQLFSGTTGKPLSESLAGPVGIVAITSTLIDNPSAPATAAGDDMTAREVRESSTLQFFTIWAFVAINLGLLNLLPIPPLDGGKLVEEALGSPIRRWAWLRRGIRGVSLTVLSLLMLLMLVVTTGDVVRILAG